MRRDQEEGDVLNTLNEVANFLPNKRIYLAGVFDQTTGYFLMRFSVSEPQDIATSHRLL